MDTNTAKDNAIKQQLRPWGGLNVAANQALSDVARAFFVPEKYKTFAFADIAIPLNSQSNMFSPKVEGRILSALDIKKDNIVFEIGAGSGYLTAVMAQLCQHITSIEIDADLYRDADEKIRQLGIDNVHLKHADASQNAMPDSFFDVVVLGASLPEMPQRFLHLLKIGGRMFAVEGASKPMTAKLITRISATDWQHQALFETELPTMQGFARKAKFEF